MAPAEQSPSLDDFEHVKLLGEGAFAAVYLVIRRADGDKYALKKVKLPSLSDKEKQNAMNEIRLLASVQHENIISYKDAFFDDKTRCLCIITEVADGGDLMQQIVRCQKDHSHIPEADIWRYFIGLANALQALHGMDIFHRDLKSANIFLSSGRKGAIAKLGDFNVSTVAKKGLCMTQTGTPYYASPEIWRDTPYDEKSDIWGLGCVMYEAAALKPPFRAEDMEGLYRKVLRGVYKRIPVCYSAELSDVIGTTLQVNPRHRPSAEQLLLLPVVRQRATVLDCGRTEPGPSELLSTIKIPRRLVDLSSHLPRPQYADHAAQSEELEAGEDGARRGERQQEDAQRRHDHHSLPQLGQPPQDCRNHRRIARSRGVSTGSQPSLPRRRRQADAGDADASRIVSSRREKSRCRQTPESRLESRRQTPDAIEQAPDKGSRPPRAPALPRQHASERAPLLPELVPPAKPAVSENQCVRLPRIASCPGQL